MAKKLGANYTFKIKSRDGREVANEILKEFGEMRNEVSGKKLTKISQKIKKDKMKKKLLITEISRLSLIHI